MSIADLSTVFSQTLRDIQREVNRTILKVPEIEQKALDATSDEPWGPHGTVMAELADATKSYNDFQMIMSVLWKRLQDGGAQWRHVYKSLVVMDFLIAQGSERCIEEIREHSYQIKSLTTFEYEEPGGKDQGINVRKKTESILALLQDSDKIREVRSKARANKAKYKGVSSESAKYGGFGSDSYGGSRYTDDGLSQNKAKVDYNDPYNRKGSYDDDKYEGGGGYEDKQGGKGKYSDKNGDRYKDEDPYRRRGRREEDEDGDYASVRAPGSGTKVTLPKESESGLVGGNDEEDDFDFDPRGAAPAPTPTPTPAPAMAPAAATTQVADLLGGDELAAPQTSDPFSTFQSVPVASDPFASFQAAPLPKATAFADPFGASAFPPPPPAQPAMTAPADLFGSFAAAPPPLQSQYGGSFNAFHSTHAPPPPSAPDMFGSSFSDFQSATPAPPAAVDPFASMETGGGPGPKSGLWADALNLGLVDLNIGSAKDSLAMKSLGIDMSTFNAASQSPSERRAEPPRANATGKGRAMGSGTGLGKAGAAGLAPPPPPVRPPGEGMMGAYPGGMMGVGMPGGGGGAGVRPGMPGMVGMGGIGGIPGMTGMGLPGMGMGMGMGGMGGPGGYGGGQVPYSPNVRPEGYPNNQFGF